MSYKNQAQEAMKGKSARKVETPYLKAEEPGFEVIGRVLSIDETDSRMGQGTYNMYTVETDEGPVRFSVGHATDMEIAGQLVIGGVYSFKYVSRQKLPSGFERKVWDVWEIPENTSGIGGADDVPPQG